MGFTVNAFCSCGLDTDIQVGRGMLDFTADYFPAMCSTCYDVVCVDHEKSPMICPQCEGQSVVPYDDPRLLSAQCENAGSSSFSWGERKLVAGDYFCPKCQKMSLHFKEPETILLFD
jgi:predicted RNA-binding Zn-ribbon protein involved in translation (DUF1610 family)